MPAVKATVKQSDLTPYLKAWKAAWDTPPAVHVLADGSVMLRPAEDADADAGDDLTPLERWKAGRENG